MAQSHTNAASAELVCQTILGGEICILGHPCTGPREIHPLHVEAVVHVCLFAGVTQCETLLQLLMHVGQIALVILIVVIVKGSSKAGGKCLLWTRSFGNLCQSTTRRDGRGFHVAMAFEILSHRLIDIMTRRGGSTAPDTCRHFRSIGWVYSGTSGMQRGGRRVGAAVPSRL